MAKAKAKSTSKTKKTTSQKSQPKKSKAKITKAKPSKLKASNNNSKKITRPKVKAGAKPALKVAGKAKAANTAKVSKSTASAGDWSEILTPLDDRVLVKPSSSEKVTLGGIIIPDTAVAAGNFKGEVLVVGRGHRDGKGRLRPMDVKKGDVILFDEFAGSKIQIMGEELRLIRETEILGIWE